MDARASDFTLNMIQFTPEGIKAVAVSISEYRSGYGPRYDLHSRRIVLDIEQHARREEKH